MSISHRLLSSALLAGAAFSAAILPLATLGSKPVTIQLEEKPVFVGQLRELSAPYLGLATGISLGVGIASLAVASWRCASHRLNQAEEELALLKQQLQEKDTVIEQLQFSEAKLQLAGLQGFLQAESVPSLTPSVVTEPTSQSPSKPMVSQPDRHVHHSSSHSSTAHHSTVANVGFSAAGLEFFLEDETVASPEVPPSTPPSINNAVQPPVAQTTGQAFKGGDCPIWGNGSEGTASSQLNQSSEQSLQLSEVMTYLKQVMTQIEQLRTQSPLSDR